MSNKEIAKKFISSVSFDGALDGAVSSQEAQALLEKMLGRPVGERLSELKTEVYAEGGSFLGLAGKEGRLTLAVEGRKDELTNMFATLFRQAPKLIEPVMEALNYIADNEEE